ncbi:MAG: hypothetical protein US24_C0011G0005 [candidate division WS6 bacterium GW2011_GWC2_36_7]|uniref:Pyridoxamine 5'-phosphate oxidase N-terminal domain-containing protein n=3 Tax=Candidatus Dojkabacteria TaxID=74243 RepID=A0A0G0FEW2_9BACT|nr:MAG: hypothetical protein US24_C0011G0005 [candidate division WS6 bacterium GW2011_GWC2_36_7]KKQ16452.1 MAG: hypothetical protein US29_C0025G0001 [candidate division WS6 bacterium GW2011_GWF1_36_8]HAM37352.1 hypothetical protein [Patescibacteria group bacterium]
MDIKIKQILKDNLYATLSTSTPEGDPWISNIYFVYDSDYNFYWYSPKDSIHSKTIKDNPSVALCIFDSHEVENVEAIYIKGKACEVTDAKELAKGLLLYGKKMLDTKFVTGKKAYIEFVNNLKDFEGQSPIRMYKVIPEKMWKLAPSQIYHDKYVDSRIEIPLIELK